MSKIEIEKYNDGQIIEDLQTAFDSAVEDLFNPEKDHMAVRKVKFEIRIARDKENENTVVLVFHAKNENAPMVAKGGLLQVKGKTLIDPQLKLAFENENYTPQK